MSSDPSAPDPSPSLPLGGKYSALADFGLDEHFLALAHSESAEPLLGRVVGVHRRFWDVATEDGTARVTLAGKRWSAGKDARKDEAQPTVGDWVLLRRESSTAALVIEHVLPRRSVLSRNRVAVRGQNQAVAANIDLLAIVIACAHQGTTDHVAERSMNPRRIERYLTAARAGNVEPIVVLNKCDLDPGHQGPAGELAQRLGVPVVPCHTTSAEGLSTLIERLRARQTVALVGLSGVGKSSIVNRLLGEEAQRIGAERAEDARGRHTTTHRELFTTASGSLLIDTPGMREFGLGDAEAEDLTAFEDVERIGAECRFRDCAHGKEPGCAVRAAAARGELELDRVESYVTLVAELRARNEKRTRIRGRPSHESTIHDWDE